MMFSIFVELTLQTTGPLGHFLCMRKLLCIDRGSLFLARCLFIYTCRSMSLLVKIELSDTSLCMDNYRPLTSGSLFLDVSLYTHVGR